ncbi:isoaspartyl peptidase/L-asparaginase [Methylobacterium sp. E-066]|uniref:isoaspartyl peptidase/L-asparaginase n=1 Tax=Methylobacterium sp. E-066 TaxID=2836584 RepID=UPI001FBC0B03|nr:isoaspartyl peptidase/L-asparaginase [Methylobacterium sp. E-066]MCJ2141788.1 isoaspartyl peptidase/L-asparaginase [Methylobacterium sp. E-066]
MADHVGVSVATAVIRDGLETVGGHGGLIAVDARGRVAMPFNTEGILLVDALSVRFTTPPNPLPGSSSTSAVRVADLPL